MPAANIETIQTTIRRHAFFISASRRSHRDYPIKGSPYGRLCRHAAQASIGADDRTRVAVPDVPHYLRESPEPGDRGRRHQPRPAAVKKSAWQDSFDVW